MSELLINQPDLHYEIPTKIIEIKAHLRDHLNDRRQIIVGTKPLALAIINSFVINWNGILGQLGVELDDVIINENLYLKQRLLPADTDDPYADGVGMYWNIHIPYKLGAGAETTVINLTAGTPRQVQNLIMNDLYVENRGAYLYIYNPVYVYGFLNANYSNETETITEYIQPDPELDNVPLFDTEECPVCFERWGLHKITTMVGNHPTKKVSKTITKCVIKRNTFCGHPLCMDCFNTISSLPTCACPVCRGNYTIQGDIVVQSEHRPLTEADVVEMLEDCDEDLLNMVNFTRVIKQEWDNFIAMGEITVMREGAMGAIPALLNVDGFSYFNDGVYVGWDFGSAGIYPN